MALKILIDRNIERNAVICQTEYIDKTVLWGGKAHTFPVLQRVDKEPRGDERFRIENLPFLASLCLAAKEEKIDFYSSSELMMERIRQKGPDDGYLGLNLMKDVKLKHCKSPVERTIVFSSLGRGYGTTEEEQMCFFKSIKHPRFIDIRRHAPEKHIDDAFHLWTAEENRLDVFLTMDKNFFRNVHQKRRAIKSSIRVLTPQLLCEELDIQKTALNELINETPPFC
ncbi:MAG: hypothetical protein CBB87_01425 [Micavibrio sp. TMED27]|nr:hypothetical protein [Micavibrio sp.]OUT92430.1 MAG: hypothetical protein CBB87_01425 [Micavibrio sp. TMED27]|tara:strand:- start:1422 stop:2099 length:678 start_codon:yes stop_codon:yes gene_type:complete